MEAKVPATDRELADEDRSFAGVSAVGALVAALGTLSCCVLPLALFSIGASGAWLGNLTALSPYQPYFIGVAVLLVGFGFWRVYRRPANGCASDSHCAKPQSRWLVKFALWMSVILVLAAIVFNQFGAYLLGLE